VCSFSRQAQYGQEEVLPSHPVDPTGAQDEVRHVNILYGSFAREFCLAVHVEWVSFVFLCVGCRTLNILPELKPEVIIHFHDVFWPFEYPREWILLGRAWNESYFLRSLLQFNDAFEIVYFSSFMAKFHADILREDMPWGLKPHPKLHAPFIGPSSLWLKKVV
jgi:hypothetical protein